MENNTKMETGREAMDVIHRIRDKIQCWSFTNTVTNLWVPDQANVLVPVKCYKRRAASVERLLACQVVVSKVKVVVHTWLTYVMQYL